MTVTPDTRIADIATQNHATIRIFQRLGIDFCCGGKCPLSEACAEKQVTFEELRRELETAGKTFATTIPMPGADSKLADLVRFIVNSYHADLRLELPCLSQMAAKVLDALEAAFDLPPRGLVHARDVLRDHGNMSAATVMFVLDQTLAAGGRGRQLMTTLGPGFTAGLMVVDIG